MRKRIYKKLEPYPHPDPLKRFMDKAIYAVAVAGPLVTIPQILRIWIDKDATGVSALSWAAFMALAAIWVIYGVLHKDKPIILANVMWFLLELFVVVGAIIY